MAPGVAPDSVAPDSAAAPAANAAGAATPATSAAVLGGGASRMRWAIGFGVAGLAVAAVFAAILVLGNRPAPVALTYIPANAVMVAEVRPDLPGDQLQKLGNLLAHFPGFADQSTLPDKLDESFARFLGRASGGSVDYKADVKPWLSGPAFVALLPAGDATGANPMSSFHGVVSLTTTGTVSCSALFDDQVARHETYRTLDLVLGPEDAAACVVSGTQALLGDPASVRAAIDAHGDGSGIDRSAAYQKARGSLQGDQLATIYINGSAYLAMFEDLAALTPGMAEMMPSLQAAFPEWAMEGLRAEDDGVVLDVVGAAPVAAPGASPGPSFLPIPPAHASAILPFAPANTIVYVEGQGMGVGLQNSITQFRAIPLYAGMLEVLDDAGSADELVGWIEDAGVLVINGESGVTGGLVVVAKDATEATERVGALKGLITAADLSSDAISTRESTIGGVTVTTVSISDLGSLVPPGQMPPGFTLPDVLEFSIAVKDRAILLGTGESFMTATLTVQTGAGLADAAGYKSATARALPNSQTTVYVAIRDIVGLVEPLIPATARAQWETEIKPYVIPFQAFSMTTAVDGTSTGRGRFTITISNP
jgi:uncharacterized protein DUF3352